MNIDKLYTVAEIVVQDYEATNAAARMNKLATTLQQSLDQKNAQTDEQYKTQKAELLKLLEESPTNDFAPSLSRVLQRVGGVDRTGHRLARRIEIIIEENTLTPASIVSDLKALHQEIANFLASLKALRDSFQVLEIAARVQEDFELGVMIPDAFVSSRLDGLQKELGKLDKRIRPFAEMSAKTTEQIRPRTLRSISSGSFDFFLDLDPVTAATIAFAIERIVKFIETLLSIRLKRRALQDEDSVTNRGVQSLVEYEKEQLEKGLDQVLKELMKRCAIEDPGRKNEVSNDLKLSLKYMAHRIDNGVEFEISVPYSEEEGDEQPVLSAEELGKIADAGSSMKRLERPEGQLLGLPAGTLLGLPAPSDIDAEEPEPATKVRL